MSIVALALGVAIGPLRPAATAPAVARTLVPALFEATRVLAATSGEGATLLFKEDGRNLAVQLFAGRPRPGGSFDLSKPVRTERLPGPLDSSLGTAPLAIFVSTSGTWSATGWSPAKGTLQVEPPCADLNLRFGPAAGESTIALACGTLVPGIP